NALGNRAEGWLTLPPGAGWRSEQHGLRGLQEPPQRAKCLRHGCRLIPAVHHAVAALGIAARTTVVLPFRRRDQLLKRPRVAFLNQVARLLPAKEVVRRVSPRRAFQLPLPLQEKQEQRRLIEAPPTGGVVEQTLE